MDESNIQSLLEELKNMVSMADVRNMCDGRIDTITMAEEFKKGSINLGVIIDNYAYIGFLEGVEFALRNIEQKDESAIPVIIHTEEKPDPEQVTVQIVTEETQTPREVNVQIITKEGEST